MASPQIASLVVGIAAKIDDLEKGFKKAEQRHKEFGGRVEAQNREMGLKNETLKRSFANVAGGILLMTGAAEKAGETGKVLEQSFGALLVGGPIAAGLVALTGAMKMMASESNAAAEKQEKALARIAAEAKKTAEAYAKVEEAAVKAADAMFREAGKASKSLFQELNPRTTEQQIADEIDALQRQAASMRPRSGRGDAQDVIEAQTVANIDERIRLLEEKLRRFRAKETAEAIEAARKTAEAEDAMLADRRLKEQVDAVRRAGREGGQIGPTEEEMRETAEWWNKFADAAERAADAQARIDESVESTLDAYRHQEALAKAVTQEERDRLEVLHQAERAMRGGASFAQGAAIFDAGIAAKTAERAREAGEKYGREMARAAEEAIRQEQQFWQSLAGTLGQGLTDAIMDGITNGFRNGQDIALRLVNSLLSQVMNSVISSGLQAIFGSLFGGGGGGLGGVVSTFVGAIGGGGGGTPLGSGGMPIAPDFMELYQSPLPAFAEGGYVTRPTVALIGEAGPEYVVPADKMRGGGGVNVSVNVNVQANGDLGAVVAATTSKVREAMLTSGAMKHALRRGSRGL